jgi:hypothetical protein
MIRLPSYLQLSAHGVYYFRAAVPDALRARLGRREIKCSLGTRSKAEAVELARSIPLSMRHLYGYLSQPMAMTFEQFRALMQRHLDEQMAAFERYFERHGPLAFEYKWNFEQGLKHQRGFAALEGDLNCLRPHVQSPVDDSEVRHHSTPNLFSATLPDRPCAVVSPAGARIRSSATPVSEDLVKRQSWLPI